MNPKLKSPPAVLIASLGTEPQVVTAALDLLRQRGEAIQRVTVLHTQATAAPVAAPLAASLAAAVEILRQAFAQPGLPPLELVPICDEAGQPLEDVETPAASRAALRAFYQQIRRAKLAGEKVHLSIAGGRKTMALFGMLAAQLLFDDDDRLWHLYSAGDFLTSKRLHPQPGDEVHLIQIPVVLWARVSPAQLDIIQYEDPFAALQRQEALRLAERLEQARSFVLGALTPAEARVAALLVREGLSDAAIAERLSLSPRTVGDHLQAAYLKAANHWELADVGRAQLITLLNLYYLN